ncbi:MAG: PepSY-associated TM helix domain-containing protein [Ilumatobacteraceae bacterium]
MSDDELLDADLDADLDEALDTDGSAAPGRRAGASSGRRRSATTNRWMRWLHVYTSMISLLVVLFFGITGLTLNHPQWTLGDAAERTTYTGTLPADFDPTSNDYLLSVSEYLRDQHDVGGTISEFGVSGTDGTLSYKAAGYAADAFFDTATGEYELVIEQQGFVGVMNDLHKGRDTTSSWKWVIDASAILLVVVSLTGLGIQLFQRKRRTRALLIAGVATVVTVVLLYVGIG